MMKSILIHSDNIEGLNYLLNFKELKGKIDLVYIDPPYATGGNFTISEGRATTVSSSRNGNIAYTDTLKGVEDMRLFQFTHQEKQLMEIQINPSKAFTHLKEGIGELTMIH